MITQNICSRVWIRIQLFRVCSCYTPILKSYISVESCRRYAEKEWLELQCWEEENVLVTNYDDWWTWVWVNSGSWWWTGRPGVLQFMGSQRVGHDWATELNWTDDDWRKLYPFLYILIYWDYSYYRKIAIIWSYFYLF